VLVGILPQFSILLKTLESAGRHRRGLNPCTEVAVVPNYPAFLLTKYKHGEGALFLQPLFYNTPDLSSSVECKSRLVAYKIQHWAFPITINSSLGCWLCERSQTIQRQLALDRPGVSRREHKDHKRQNPSKLTLSQRQRRRSNKQLQPLR